MNLDQVIAELREERLRIDRALQALEGLKGTTSKGITSKKNKGPKVTGRKRRTMSKEARAKISAAQKKRWAAHKKH